jgi:hypothetical protein
MALGIPLVTEQAYPLLLSGRLMRWDKCRCLERRNPTSRF